MKKCYIVPVASSQDVEITSFLSGSPFTDGSNKISIQGSGNDGQLDQAGVEEDGEARQRGGDFGSLW